MPLCLVLQRTLHSLHLLGQVLRQSPGRLLLASWLPACIASGGSLTAGTLYLPCFTIETTEYPASMICIFVNKPAGFHGVAAQ